MPAIYEVTITQKGLNLRAKSEAAGNGIEFTRLVAGDGEHDSGEDLLSLQDLKHPIQETGFSGKKYVSNATVMLKAVLDNEKLEAGYYLREIGVYAMDPDDGEILYSISLAEQNQWDYLPESQWGAASIQLSIDTTISNADYVVLKPWIGAYALAEDLDALKNPVFEDYESGAPLPDVDVAIAEILSGRYTPELFQFIKASLLGLYQAVCELILIWDLDGIENEFLTVFTMIGLRPAMDQDEIADALAYIWSGETSKNIGAMSAEEVEEAISTKWTGQASENPDALTPDEVEKYTQQ